MPNWTDNQLIISGRAKHLKEFAQTLNTPNNFDKDSPFSFHQTLPIPDNVYKGEWDKRLQDHLISCDYDGSQGISVLDWTREHWGVKWDASSPKIENEEDVEDIINGTHRESGKMKIVIKFSTPWCPPVPWLASVARKYPKLQFQIAWSECGMGHYGLLTAEDDYLNDDCREITDDDIVYDEDDEFSDYGGRFGKFLKDHSIGSGG